MAESLSHRQRVLLALDHRTTDRVPIAMVCSGINEPARTQLDATLRRERGLGLDAYLEPLIDIATLGPPYVGPPLGEGTDIWGVHRSAVSYGPAAYAEIDHYPLAEVRSVDDLARHRWPSADWFDYDALAAAIARDRAAGDHCLVVGNGNPFERSWYMRGFEQFLFDMRGAPELARAILERVTNFFVAYFERVLAAADGEVDLVFTADDIGHQQGLLMSLDDWATFLRPCHERINRVVHAAGARVIYHSDGSVAAAVPGLVDAGIDVLQALQFDAAGMDPADLKGRFGDRLCFEGGVSVQQTLPFGTADDVRAEVERLIGELGRGGGYMLGPSHVVQAGTPPENIVAMFDTAAATPMPGRARSA